MLGIDTFWVPLVYSAVFPWRLYDHCTEAGTQQGSKYSPYDVGDKPTLHQSYILWSIIPRVGNYIMWAIRIQGDTSSLKCCEPMPWQSKGDFIMPINSSKKQRV